MWDKSERIPQKEKAGQFLSKPPRILRPWNCLSPETLVQGIFRAVEGIRHPAELQGPKPLVRICLALLVGDDEETDL